MIPIGNKEITWQGRKIRLLVFGPGNYHLFLKLIQKKLEPTNVDKMMEKLTRDILRAGD